MLAGLIEVSKAADDLGYWGITPRRAPRAHRGDGDLPRAAHAQHLRRACTRSASCTASSASCCPAHDPIRLAEEIAIADHMLQGRLFVGMARGYQARWQNVLCQRFGVTSTASDGGDADQRNRLLFSENFKIMKKAWARGPAHLRRPDVPGPLPVRPGIPNWPPAQDDHAGPTASPGEVDDDGTIRGHRRRAEALHVTAPAAVPGVRRQPRHAAVVRRGERHPDDPHGRSPRSSSSSWRSTRRAPRPRGRNPALGEGIGVCRTFYVVPERHEPGRGRRADRAERAQVRGAGVARLVRAVRLHGGRAAARRGGSRPGPDESLKRAPHQAAALLIGGTVDDVKRQVEAFLQELPIDYFVWLFHWGMIPREEAPADAGALRDRDHARVRHGRVLAGGGRGRRLTRCPG